MLLQQTRNCAVTSKWGLYKLARLNPVDVSDWPLPNKILGCAAAFPQTRNQEAETPCKIFLPLEKCVGHSLKKFGHSQKTSPPWCPKLVRGLPSPTSLLFSPKVPCKIVCPWVPFTTFTSFAIVAWRGTRLLQFFSLLNSYFRWCFWCNPFARGKGLGK